MILAILENQHVAMSWDGFQLRSSSGTTMHGLVMMPMHTTTVPDPTKKRHSIREEDYRRSSGHGVVLWLKKLYWHVSGNMAEQALKELLFR